MDDIKARIYGHFNGYIDEVTSLDKDIKKHLYIDSAPFNIDWILEIFDFLVIYIVLENVRYKIRTLLVASLIAEPKF